MVLINAVKKIEPIILSKRLEIGLCNPSGDWISGFIDDFKEEIMLEEHFFQSNLEYYTEPNDSRIDVERIAKSLGWNGTDTAMRYIAMHLIEIQFLDFDTSLLKLKNVCDSPTCEPQYTRKFLKFCDMLSYAIKNHNYKHYTIPFPIYNSDELDEKQHILRFISAYSHPHRQWNIDINAFSTSAISTLEDIGGRLDAFLKDDNDFYLLDYIFNAIYHDDDYNAYYVFKIMSLIELLIMKTNRKVKTADEMARKLPQFHFSGIDDEQKADFAKLLWKFRNKIAHGEFESLQKLLTQYREKYMKEFWFDEYEYSIENWTYGDIGLRLNSILSEILWLLISDTEQLMKIKNG